MLASKRLLTPSALFRLSTLSSSKNTPRLAVIRCFSGSEDDPFGVNYKDGEGNIGPSEELPPKLVRDRMTGKLTGVVEQTLTDQQKKLLEMDEIDSQKKMMDDLVESWVQSESDKIGDPIKQAQFASRIREETMALNVFGRSPEATSLQGKLDTGDDALYSDLSSDLSPKEFKSLQKYMSREKDYELKRNHDDVPVKMSPYRESTYANPDPDLDLRWLSSGSHSEMDGGKVEDPFADLMPHDLNPARLVNREKAKQIPTELVHHNNIVLLRRYLTPGGQIMNRVQSRLGAKDQRKMSKLIKRARSLGLIPYMGQWKVENHGSIYDSDIFLKRKWEEELEDRGLVPPKIKEADWEAMRESATLKYQKEAKRHVGLDENPWEADPWCLLADDIYLVMKTKGIRLTKNNDVYLTFGISQMKLSGSGDVVFVDKTGVIAEGRFELSQSGAVSLSWNKAVKWKDDHWESVTTADLVTGFKFTDQSVAKSTLSYGDILGKRKVSPIDAMKANEFSAHAIEWSANELRKYVD